MMQEFETGGAVGAGEQEKLEEEKENLCRGRVGS
jgi:hypothetical protein